MALAARPIFAEQRSPATAVHGIPQGVPPLPLNFIRWAALESVYSPAEGCAAPSRNERVETSLRRRGHLRAWAIGLSIFAIAGHIAGFSPHPAIGYFTPLAVTHPAGLVPACVRTKVLRVLLTTLCGLVCYPIRIHWH